jgi:energy-coupling factor transporter ATP-binding protein EcfA2
MDPVNKRFMWEVIARVCTSQKECSIILTTHSMEECEALCTRAGIMVGGRLRCLGSLTHLKAKFGDGYQVDLKLIQPSEEDVADITKRLSSVASSGVLRAGELQQACDALGDGSRRTLITETDPAGCGLWHVLNLNGAIPIVDFATVRLFSLRFSRPSAHRPSSNFDEDGTRASLPRIKRTQPSELVLVRAAVVPKLCARACARTCLQWWILQNLSCALADFVQANFRGSVRHSDARALMRAQAVRTQSLYYCLSSYRVHLFTADANRAARSQLPLQAAERQLAG